jgi:hypothetical protein
MSPSLAPPKTHLITGEELYKMGDIGCTLTLRCKNPGNQQARSRNLMNCRGVVTTMGMSLYGLRTTDLKIGP